MKVSLKSSLMGLVLLVLLLGLVPAGLLLDRRLVGALEQGVRDDLSTAPLVLRDRWQNQAGARMMHAREMALDPVLVAALIAGDPAAAMLRAEQIAGAFPGESAVVIGADGGPWMGPEIHQDIVDSTRAGVAPVMVMESGDELGTVAIAPVDEDGAWRGAVGVWVPMTSDEAARLSVLTRSDVLLMAPDEDLAAYTGRAEPAMGLFGLLARQPVSDEVREFALEGERYLLTSAHLPGGARVTFVRALSEELAVVPTLRAVGAGVFGLALVLALAVGVWFATRLARPVGSVAGAAARISQGDFNAPVERSVVAEVDQVAEAFEVMRDALEVRIEELAHANRELEDRQERLGVLQAELVQRDRLSAASRLLAQLAHEIRNPVASVRNCLEVLRRRVQGDEEASELADLAIDELLRMHELAEQMLDLHRPRGEEGDCDAARIVRDVASVARVGLGDRDIVINVDAPDSAPAEIPGDSLKQVLLNLFQNAQDAMGDRGVIDVRVTSTAGNVRIDVVDSGPGITDEALPQLFDPFFTTKADVQGVGLGLFTAAGIVRTHGGRIAAANRSDRSGARLTVEVPQRSAVRAEASA
ncbi:MAG: HAMP domain-containing histidine kinase [Gemmatimonadota bacterium]|nr:HAMP domain-containing histidine kinase [Gemmatimonadota bacterium]